MKFISRLLAEIVYLMSEWLGYPHIQIRGLYINSTGTNAEDLT